MTTAEKSVEWLFSISFIFFSASALFPSSEWALTAAMSPSSELMKAGGDFPMNSRICRGSEVFEIVVSSFIHAARFWLQRVKAVLKDVWLSVCFFARMSDSPYK